jgi:putative NADH-flavin reductase
MSLELLMKIAIVGATGNVGSRLVKEALSRGHQVTAIARDASRAPADKNLSAVSVDAGDARKLADALRGHDAVISSLRFRGVPPETLIEAVRGSGVKRYLVVGGAASLEIAPGKILLESPDFPPAYIPEASAGKAFLQALRKVDDLDWTYLSPSVLFIAGQRTGKFRLGKESLLTAADGKSWISYEDYSIALLDEIERPQHIRSRFTVGY